MVSGPLPCPPLHALTLCISLQDLLRDFPELVIPPTPTVLTMEGLFQVSPPMLDCPPKLFEEDDAWLEVSPLAFTLTLMGVTMERKKGDDYYSCVPNDELLASFPGKPSPTLPGEPGGPGSNAGPYRPRP